MSKQQKHQVRVHVLLELGVYIDVVSTKEEAVEKAKEFMIEHMEKGLIDSGCAEYLSIDEYKDYGSEIEEEI